MSRYEEREVIRDTRRVPTRYYDDDDDRRSRGGGAPDWLRDDTRPRGGELVLVSREKETIERERPRARSVVRETSRPPADRVRYVVQRSRSPSPDIQERERDRIRIVAKNRAPSPARKRSPTPPPKVIKGPRIEREVVTHYVDVDHGVVQARAPSPPPPVRQRETEIDIYHSRNRTELEVRRDRARSVSRNPPPSRDVYYDDGDVVVRTDRKHLHVDIERRRSVSRGPAGRRRAHSAAPPIINHRHDSDSEAEYITKTIDSRGRMGEARNGATRDWTIIDVPPGTERVRMDGAGGASAEVTWQKYSGVRRTKFIPDREERSSSSSLAPSTVEKERRLSVSIIKDERRGKSPARRPADTWTEITKDLVCREAIEEMGYEYEEEKFAFYITDYLTHDQVVRLIDLSDRIRDARRERAREIARQRDWEDAKYARDHEHRHRYEVEYVDSDGVEHEVVYEKRHHHDRYR